MLSVYAGKRAYEHVRKNGLLPTDVNRIMGASGAAKWLAIAGLDKAIFGRWFNDSSHRIFVSLPSYLCRIFVLIRSSFIKKRNAGLSSER